MSAWQPALQWTNVLRPSNRLPRFNRQSRDRLNCPLIRWLTFAADRGSSCLPTVRATRRAGVAFPRAPTVILVAAKRVFDLSFQEVRLAQIVRGAALPTPPLYARRLGARGYLLDVLRGMGRCLYHGLDPDRTCSM